MELNLKSAPPVDTGSINSDQHNLKSAVLLLALYVR